MKKVLALVLCLIMVAAVAVSTISADETKRIDARELGEYGQYHFYLPTPVAGTSIPNVTDGKVSENEYQAFFEAKVDPTNADPVTYWADHDTLADGSKTGKYWDNEWSKFYMSYDENTLYFGYATKDINFVDKKDRVSHMISFWDHGSQSGAVGRLGFVAKATVDGTPVVEIANFKKNEDGSWDKSVTPVIGDYLKESSCGYDASTQILYIEFSIDLLKAKEFFGNDMELKDARMYWSAYARYYGESVKGAGDMVCQGILWCYLKGDADPAIKMNFVLDYPELSYWGNPMMFPHIVHFCEKPAETTAAPTTTAEPTTAAPTTTKAATTAAATTVAATTVADASAAATTAAATEAAKGCKSTVALSALALVPMLGAAVVFGKKRED